MICTDKEVRKQLEELYVQCDSLGFSDWEFTFINDIWERKFESLSAKQKQIITKIFMKYLE